VTTGSGRTMRLLAGGLLVSLCLNLFAAGAWFSANRLVDRRVDASVGSLMRGYPPELRREVMRRLAVDRPAFHAAIAELRAARQRMRAAMRAEPFAPDEVTRSMGAVRAATTTLQARLHVALAASLAQTPIEGRRRIEPRLEDPDEVEP